MSDAKVLTNVIRLFASAWLWRLAQVVAPPQSSWRRRLDAFPKGKVSLAAAPDEVKK